MLVPSAPLLLSRRRDSLTGLGLGPACAERLGGERGSSVLRGMLSATCSNGVRSAASYPQAGAVIPISLRTGGMSACMFVKLGVALKAHVYRNWRYKVLCAVGEIRPLSETCH